MSHQNKKVRIRLRDPNRAIVWETVLPGNVLDYTSRTAQTTFTLELEIVEAYYDADLPPMDPT